MPTRDPHQQLTDAAHAIAIDYRHSGRWNEAVSLLAAAIAHGKHVAPLQILLADLLIKRAELDRAAELLKAALASLPPDPIRADAFYQMGDVAYMRRFMREEGDWQTALDYHKRALAARQQIGDQRGICLSLSRIGILHERQDDDDTAMQLYQEAVELGQTIGFPQGTRRPLTHIGAIMQRGGNLPDALVYYRKALAISEELGEADGTMFGLGNVGMALFRLHDDVATALDYLGSALTMAESMGHRMMMASLSFRLAVVHTGAGNLKKARAAYKRVIAACEPIGYHRFAEAARQALREL